MPDRISKTQRWLDLIAYLVGRRLPVAVDEIMERVPSYAAKWRTDDETAHASARRAFERDKDELRELGIPLETVEYAIDYGGERAQGYRLARRDFYLPYLKLVEAAAGETLPAPSESGTATTTRDPSRIPQFEIGEDDAQASLDALRRATSLPAFPFAREARSAFRKLAFDLDPDRLPGAPVLYLDRPGAETLREEMRVLSDALQAHKRVRFTYHGIYRHRATERDVAPYGLFFQGGHWYLVGHDAARDDLRVFRVGRMEGVTANEAAPHTPDFEIPADFRLDDFLSLRAWELGGEEDPLVAHVLFRFPASLWAERNGYGRQAEERGDGSVVREFDVQQVNPFLRWLLSLEGEAELLSPPELREELRALALEVSELYEADA